MNPSFVTDNVQVLGTLVQQVSTELVFKDFLGALRVRWGIGRDDYKVNPGLYAVGSPDSSSDVFVTSNYKLTFDHLRKNLAGLNGWILVLDTKGVNVWCAAGKGTFGTKELVKRIQLASLGKVVIHRRLILPQLGATGVAAHIVKEETGFNVHYGPIRAADIKGFISDGYRATKEMRKVTFNFSDRIRLIPNDFMYGKLYLLGAFALVFIIAYFGRKGNPAFSPVKSGIMAILNIFLGYCAGIIITPMLLPWLPGKRFAVKGFFAGVLTALIMFFLNNTGNNIFEIIAGFMMISSISSFMAMNFTGSSTYTSLSGVKKEMKTALPSQIIISALGLILFVIGKFIY
jgi:hypothetical protein